MNLGKSANLSRFKACTFHLLLHRLDFSAGRSWSGSGHVCFAAVAALGIGLHSFVDGVVYAVTFQASTVMGVLAATGMVVHEFSEGVITYVVLQEAGVRKRLVHIYAFVIAALTTPIGAFLAFPFVNELNPAGFGFDDRFFGGCDPICGRRSFAARGDRAG